jgi:hypothetical protein
MHADPLGRQQVRLGVGLSGGHVLGAYLRVEPHSGAGQHGLHEAALGGGDQHARQAGASDRGEQFARAGPDRHALAADAVGDVGHEPLADQFRRCGPGRLREQVPHGPVQAAAQQRGLIFLGPARPEPLHDHPLGLEPQRLGVDEQPVHVE